ncbi:MAG: threonine/serine exporter family protein [Hornefia sp.]|nr:threonine/serine exporter family protein [Hornefia sp.]
MSNHRNGDEKRLDYDKILQTILDIGEEMIVAGGEVSRVEESVFRMCKAYGCDRINVYILLSNMQVTVETPEKKIITHIRFMERNDVNFDRLDYLNDLSRYICANVPDVETMSSKLCEVMSRKEQPIWLDMLGDILAASGFIVFFGGSFFDAVAGVFMAMLVFGLQRFFIPRENNQLVLNFVISFVAGMFALILVHMGLNVHGDKIMMGGIMLLIPGIAMTNAVRDMLIGDLASGLLRLSNALMVAASIACGFAMSIALIGGVL